ncbi:acetate/propionate family kinase [Brucella anthropi]|uniref:Acetate kinase n=1 Tax=Brucella anthropi TaxID=529 RepID=A0A6I0DLZ9_BRUAN|nr:acetate/propionate family kinase [Brucella anthropi]KAB2797217.1 acetate/propionate family kinase [Brucella anthropi]
MDKQLITFNAGSSSVKLGFFAYDGEQIVKFSRGGIDLNGSPLTFRLRGELCNLDIALDTSGADEIAVIVEELFSRLSTHTNLSRMLAVGHRVVFGGDQFIQPILVDDKHINAIERLSSFAPLHQAKSVALIRGIQKLFPHVKQTVSFDTAFHQTIPEVIRRFALPREFHERGLKRYGFHGLSYKSIIGSFSQKQPKLAVGRIVVAHLGSGASLCAIKGGKSIDTSMSFSTLDGIPMATRCGALDPGLLLYFLQQENMFPDALSDLLYHRSGLLGLSGISGDTRDLLESNAPHAREALEVFTLRIAGEIARLVSTLGGLDALIFTAGIGENQPEIRAAVCLRLSWLGIDLNISANNRNTFRITTNSSRTAAFVLPTDEERIIALETLQVLENSAA